MTEWINVEDRLPETRSQVHGPEDKRSSLLLLYSEKHGIVIGYLDEVDSNHYDWIVVQLEDYFLLKDITHWTPLPESPEELKRKENFKNND